MVGGSLIMCFMCLKRSDKQEEEKGKRINSDCEYE
jgi:hypothetical protein